MLTDCIYLEVGGRGLTAIEDCVELAVRGLVVSIYGSEERLIQAARGDKLKGLEAVSVLEKAKKEKGLQDWEEKALRGQYLGQTEEARSEQSWVWLQNGDLNRETESPILAAQNQIIRTNLVKAKIDKSQKDTLCRLCKKADESIDHGCCEIAQKEYKRRHDNLGRIVNWKLARKGNFEAGDKWYEHQPESVLENEDYKILSDFSIHADHVIEAQRPDLVVVDMRGTCEIIDFAVPGDSGIEEKEKGVKKGVTEDLGCESENYFGAR